MTNKEKDSKKNSIEEKDAKNLSIEDNSSQAENEDKKIIKEEKNNSQNNSEKKLVSKDKDNAKHADKSKKYTKEKVNNFKEKFKNLKWKKIGIITGSCIAGIYLLGAVLFSFVSYPNTVVADTDISFRTQSLMKEALIPNSGEYVFNAEGYGFNLEIEGSSIEYNFNVDEVVDKVLSLKNPLIWPFEILRNHDFMEESVVSYNKETATSLALIAIDNHNVNAEIPQNANFICDTASRTVGIKEEVIGNAVNPETTLDAILSYIGTGRRHLELREEQHLTPNLYADDYRIPAAIEQANKLLQSVMTLQLATTPIATIDYTLLSQWIQLKEDYVAGLNDEILTGWVAQLANQYDTVGKRRTFTTPYGKTCSVSGGDGIGWQIDQAATIEEINKQAVLGITTVINTPCLSSMNGYAGPGTRDWGARYIDVDLSQQIARMYGDNSELLWQADIVSGKPSTATPTGIYTIKGKQSPSVLIGAPDPITGEPSYRSTVQYWMPFVGNSIGFHDATWQEKFGGDWWVEHGSHGCVNLAYGTAASLYSLCVAGDVVVVHY